MKKWKPHEECFVLVVVVDINSLSISIEKRSKITLPGTLPLYCLVASLLVMPDVIVEKLNSWRGCTRKEKKLNVKDTIKKHIWHLPAWTWWRQTFLIAIQIFMRMAQMQSFWSDGLYMFTELFSLVRRRLLDQKSNILSVGIPTCPSLIKTNVSHRYSDLYAAGSNAILLIR